MTHATPPGWYPDPGQTPGAPPSERWWDGNTWTDHVRAPGGSGLPAPGYPAAPGYPVPGHPQQPSGPPRRRIRTAIGVFIALAVLAGIGGGVYALTAADDDDKDSAKPPAPSAPSKPGPQDDGGGKGPEDSPSPGPSGGPRTEEGYATDIASGISLPVPDGWDGESKGVGASVTTGKYPCPGDSANQCVRGGAFSVPAAGLKITASTPEAAAKADIKKNAAESYGGKIYGGAPKSHDQLASKAVTVAGQKGYLVRWKVDSRKGPDGYVQSLAFKSPADKITMVLVRFGIDVHDDAPPLSSMDEITKGIKKARGGGGGGGAGQQVHAPTSARQR
ncbi:DUF2510 domain-containing protein [Streptomyces spectabilis]|uniref:DUF2510 domain-containing protein n=1 Tax=Streptomyces spectabilis TaxID=68270 RepID=A0A516RG77_STRST|nr:DUF2510 domain-containing protein [Streptomyces spectabilis]QDQ14666.1 DUF2510 domain-containing protein [Streptomyces spectabilis]